MTTPASRFDPRCLAACAGTLACELAAFFLLYPISRLHFGLAHYLKPLLGVEYFLGWAPSVIVPCILLIAFVKQPLPGAVLEPLFERGDRLRRCLQLLALHAGLSLAFVAFSLLLLNKGFSASPAAQAKMFAWQSLGDLSAFFLASACLQAYRGRLPRAAQAAPMALLLGLVAVGAVARLQMTIAPSLARLAIPPSRAILELIFDTVVYRPESNALGVPGFTVYIRAPCSGSEGLALMLLFCGLFWTVFRDKLRFPRALLILPIGLVAGWCLNVLRIVALICIGKWVSKEAAMDAFHSSAGWVVFCALAGGLGVAAASLPVLGGGFLKPSLRGNAAAPYLVPFLAALMVIFATRTNAEGFERLYPLRVAAAAAALFYFRRHYARARWSASWGAVGLGVLAAGVWLLTGGSASIAPAGALAALSAEYRTLWLAFRIIGAVVVIPIIEELAFRGFLARWLDDTDFDARRVGDYTPFSFVASSAAFGFLHEDWFAGILTGMLFALAAMRRKQLGDAVVAHVTANAVVAGLALFLR